MNSTQQQPRVAILIPVYGVAKYIALCARTLFEQTMSRDVEFIFVDDCSPDESVALLERVLEEYPARREQVRILHHDHNRGLAAARATAIEATCAQWVLHVDSDDWIAPTALEELLRTADQFPAADIVMGGYCQGENPQQPCRSIAPPSPDRALILRTLLSQSHHITNRIWGMLIRRTLYLADTMPRQGVNFAEDYAVVPRLIYRARAVAVCPTPLYGYRTLSTGSFMNSLTEGSASQYVTANCIVSDFMYAQPDYAQWRDVVLLGKLNVKKWILKRGFQPQDYNAQLFAGDYPITRLSFRCYNRLLDSRCTTLARIVGLLLNR